MFALAYRISASERNVSMQKKWICLFIMVRASLTGFMNITMLFALRFVGVFHNFTQTHTHGPRPRMEQGRKNYDVLSSFR